ncbi:MAG: hypothetical protein AMXMBFR47_21770 [Planctomycetota bacterium]
MAVDPFVAHADWENNACTSSYGWLDFDRMAEYYLRSATALVECMERDHAVLDVHIYATCFLYRQALELSLKSLAWKADYIRDGRRTVKDKHHDLCELWGKVKTETRRLLASDFPLNTGEVAEVDEFLIKFQKHDPSSFAFRYPYEKRGKWTLADLHNVNIRALREACHAVYELLCRLERLLEFLSREAAEAKRA